MAQTLETATSIIRVDLPAVKRNIEKIKKHIGPDTEIIYVAKSNGYGNGIAAPAVYMKKECGIHYFAASQIGEAMELREAGIDDFLLVLSAVPFSAIPKFVELGLVATVYDDSFAGALSAEAVKQGKTVKVHIKIDTGLHRIGLAPGEPLAHLIQTLKELPNLEIDGVYTHLANAYSLDKTVTREQTALFKKALAQLHEAGIYPRMTHMANTAACVASPECYYDAVRLAALVYGHDISPGEKNRLKLECATSWRCYVLNTMWVEAGESVSYYRYFVPQRRTRIALVSFGMGDGYIRAAVSQNTSKNADVLINGYRARLIDLNFDQTFVDITDVPGEVKIGDVVTIIGKDGSEEITTVEIAEHAHTSNGNVCAAITSRPFRQYIYEDGENTSR